MARIARVVVLGLPHHVTQRGNRREPVFFDADDYRPYRQLVAAAARRAGAPVHLIVTPTGITVGITVTVYRIAPRRYNHLANRLKKAQAWLGSRALLCRTCPTMSRSAAIGASRCFSRPTTIASIGDWSPRQRGALAQQSGPIV
jgi:hypothetical protein